MGHRLRTSTTTITAGFAAVASVVAVLLFATAPVAGASKADDVKAARAGTLVAVDFPSDWTGTRSQAISDEQAIKVASKIPGCSQYVKLRKITAVLPEARSLEYSDGVATTASNVVTAFSSHAKAAAALKLFSGSTIASCLEKFTVKGAGGGIEVSVAQSDVSNLGDAAIAYTAEVSAPDGSKAKFINIAVKVGRFVDVYSFQNSDDNPPNDILEAATASSLTRLQDEQ